MSILNGSKQRLESRHTGWTVGNGKELGRGFERPEDGLNYQDAGAVIILRAASSTKESHSEKRAMVDSNGNTIYLNVTVYDRSVTVNIDYRVERARDGSLIGERTKSASSELNRFTTFFMVFTVRRSANFLYRDGLIIYHFQVKFKYSQKFVHPFGHISKNLQYFLCI